MRVCPRCNAVFKAPIMSCSGDGTTLVDRADDPHLSSSLGRFLLESLIAEGVTGRIYRSQAAAVRILYGDFGTQELIVKRMMRDVEAAKELQHPNVSRILDTGTDDGSTWIATELAAGQTLDSLIEGQMLDLLRVGSICAQIAAALAEAHDNDILHRNLAPNNVMVAPKGKRDVVKVLDFGLGSLSRSSQAVRFRAHRDYAAPEALKPSGATKAGDVYSLGLIAKDLISKAGNGKTDLGNLVAAMMDPDPAKRPQNGREVLTRLDDLGYSPIAFPSAKTADDKLSFANMGVAVSENLEDDLLSDGLVLVSAAKAAGVEPTVPTATPDFVAAHANTTFVYKGGEPPPEPSFDKVDIEESRKKIEMLENANKRKKTTVSRMATEKMNVAPNGTAMLGEEPPTELIQELHPPIEGTHAAIEVTASQLLDSIVDAHVEGDLDTVGSGDIEAIPDDPLAFEDTNEEAIPLPSSKTAPPLRDPAETLPLLPPMNTPPPTLHSAAEMQHSKAIGGVQQLPAEHGERPSSRPGKSAFRPKGSWPTEDLVLPSKAGSSNAPSGFGDDLRRAPTSVIRTRGVFSSEFDVPDRPGGIMSARETDVIRPRSPSEIGGPAPRSDTLPIDRANTVVDPAEAARSMDLRLRSKRSMIPIAAGAIILTIAGLAIALPRLDSDKEKKEVRQPVLIQPQPEDDDVAALDEDLPEGDAHEAAEEEKEPAKEPPAPEPAPEPVKEPVKEPPQEVATPEPPPPPPPPVVKPKPKVEPEPEPEAEEEDLPKHTSEKKKKPKRPSAKAAPKKEQPDKLERGTLIDPFAE